MLFHNLLVVWVWETELSAQAEYADDTNTK